MGDAADLDHHDRVADEVARRFGAADIYMANAGIIRITPSAQVTPVEFDAQFAVKARGAFFGVQKTAPVLRDGGASAIAVQQAMRALKRYCRGMDDAEPPQRLHNLVMALRDPNVTVTARSLMSFRLKYLDIADAAARSLADFEQDNRGLMRWYDDAFMRATTAVIFSFSAVEAAINEALMDLDIRDPLYAVIERQGPIEQVELIAAVRGFEPMQRGAEPVGSMHLLRELRNSLIHAKAEWSDDEATHAKLAKRLDSSAIKRSPLASSTDRTFPIACMSASVAAWSVASARSFIADFHESAIWLKIPHFPPPHRALSAHWTIRFIFARELKNSSIKHA